MQAQFGLNLPPLVLLTYVALTVTTLSKSAVRADSLCPKELSLIRPFRVACYVLSVTDWIPRTAALSVVSVLPLLKPVCPRRSGGLATYKYIPIPRLCCQVPVGNSSGAPKHRYARIGVGLLAVEANFGSITLEKSMGCNLKELGQSLNQGIAHSAAAQLVHPNRHDVASAIASIQNLPYRLFNLVCGGWLV